MGKWILSTATAVLIICILTCFTSIVLLALRRGTTVPSCGCSGILRAGPLTWGAAVRNGMLSAVVAYTLLCGYLEAQVPKGALATAGIRSPEDLLLTLSSGVLILVIVLSAEELIALGQRAAIVRRAVGLGE